MMSGCEFLEPWLVLRILVLPSAVMIRIYKSAMNVESAVLTLRVLFLPYKRVENPLG